MCPRLSRKVDVNCDDFVLVSSVLLSRCKDTFAELDSGLHGRRPVCFNGSHRWPMPRFTALVRGAAIQFLKKHSCKAQPADFVSVSEVLQVAAQVESGVKREEALT